MARTLIGAAVCIYFLAPLALAAESADSRAAMLKEIQSSGEALLQSQYQKAMAEWVKTQAPKRGAGFQGIDLGMSLDQLPPEARDACTSGPLKGCELISRLDDMPTEVSINFWTMNKTDEPARVYMVDVRMPIEFYERILSALKARYGNPVQDQFGPLWQWRPPIIPKELNYQPQLVDSVRLQRTEKWKMKSGQPTLLISYTGHGSAMWRDLLKQDRGRAAKANYDQEAESKRKAAASVPNKRLGEKL